MHAAQTDDRQKWRLSEQQNPECDPVDDGAGAKTITHLHDAWLELQEDAGPDRQQRAPNTDHSSRPCRRRTDTVLVPPFQIADQWQQKLCGTDDGRGRGKKRQQPGCCCYCCCFCPVVVAPGTSLLRRSPTIPVAVPMAGSARRMYNAHTCRRPRAAGQRQPRITPDGFEPETGAASPRAGSAYQLAFLCLEGVMITVADRCRCHNRIVNAVLDRPFLNIRERCSTATDHHRQEAGETQDSFGGKIFVPAENRRVASSDRETEKVTHRPSGGATRLRIRNGK